MLAQRLRTILPPPTVWRRRGSTGGTLPEQGEVIALSPEDLDARP
jgi:hypothetical protein